MVIRRYTVQFFGDDLNKEVEEHTKSNKLSGTVTTKHLTTVPHPTSYHLARVHGDKVILISPVEEAEEQDHIRLF